MLGIGKELLRSSTQDGPGGNSARDSVKWIQRAFSIIEPLEDALDTGDGHLRVCVVLYHLLAITRTHVSCSSDQFSGVCVSRPLLFTVPVCH